MLIVLRKKTHSFKKIHKWDQDQEEEEEEEEEEEGGGIELFCQEFCHSSSLLTKLG